MKHCAAWGGVPLLSACDRPKTGSVKRGVDARPLPLVAFAANRKKSLSGIFLPPVAETNAQPSDKTRPLRYKLAPGEAGWVPKLDRTVGY